MWVGGSLCVAPGMPGVRRGGGGVFTNVQQVLVVPTMQHEPHTHKLVRTMPTRKYTNS